jgi:protein-S-isoprenylcysteine O-methyltransferase Ste14
MADEKKPNFPRLLSLFVALLGCVVVAVPMLFPLTNPAPLILIGSGVTVVALGVFLFFSF